VSYLCRNVLGCWLHTDWQAHPATAPTPFLSGSDQRLTFVAAAMLSEQWQWYRAAAHLSAYYRQHLARLVGATGLLIPHQISLLLPDAVWADRRLTAAAGKMAPEQSQEAVTSVLSRYGWSA